MPGRPTKKPRLCRMTRADVLDDVRAMFAGEPIEAMLLASQVYAYAKDGGDLEPARIRRLAALLYSAPARKYDEIDPTFVVVGREAERPIDAVLLAAEARLAIEKGNRCTLRALAALASVHPHEVGRLIREGRIGTVAQKHDGRAGASIPPGAAARWLRERGVTIEAGGTK